MTPCPPRPSQLNSDAMMTHADRIAAMLRAADKELPRHGAAWREPQPNEALVVGFTCSAAAYADKHHAKSDSTLRDAGISGEWWAESLSNTRDLMAGDCGRLDRGTVDALIRDMLKAEGFEELK